MILGIESGIDHNVNSVAKADENLMVISPTPSIDSQIRIKVQSRKRKIVSKSRLNKDIYVTNMESLKIKIMISHCSYDTYIMNIQKVENQ